MKFYKHFTQFNTFTGNYDTSNDQLMVMVMPTMTIYLQYLLCLFLASNSGKLFVSPLIDPHTATLMVMMTIRVLLVMGCNKSGPVNLYYYY